MITKIALTVALGLSVACMWLMWSNASLEADNAALSRSLAAMEQQAEKNSLAREVERARAEGFAARNAELSTVIEGLLIGDIPDAPLHPSLADAINSLRAD